MTSISSTRTVFAAGVSTAAALLALNLAVPSSAEPQRPADADRGARVLRMLWHYTDALHLHQSVISGNLGAAKDAASAFGATGFEWKDLSPGARTAVAALRETTERAARATSIEAAAEATAAAMAACGDCHRASGVMPAMSLPERPDVGGTVGHMLQHQSATDRLQQGLVVPSNSEWFEGAAGLQRLPLRSPDLPRDPRLSREVLQSEERVHQLAEKAATARDTATRVQIYGEILTTCAQCHGLRHKVWGPAN